MSNAALAIVTAAVAAGELSPEEGQGIAAVIDVQRRSLESVEFEQRLSALERRKGFHE